MIGDGARNGNDTTTDSRKQRLAFRHERVVLRGRRARPGRAERHRLPERQAWQGVRRTGRTVRG